MQINIGNFVSVISTDIQMGGYIKSEVIFNASNPDNKHGRRAQYARILSFVNKRRARNIKELKKCQKKLRK